MFQFGLRTMLALTLAAAVLFALALTVPEKISHHVTAIGMMLAIPAMVAGLVYDRNYGRAFSIGGLSWIGVHILQHRFRSNPALNLRVMTPGWKLNSLA